MDPGSLEARGGEAHECLRTQQKEEEVLANIHLGTNQGVTLPIAVPIYLVYWTAWVDQDGKKNFRHDIYDRDTRLYELFES